jgi:GNAT superfamily N-acetyltransferase
MLTIRFAQADDADTILHFIRELAIYEREPEAVKVTGDELREQLADATPPFECLLAEEAGVACGFALFFHNYSTWRGRRGLYLEDLFVPPAHRGRGIGKRLLGELASIAVERGCARLEWAVLDWNQPAIDFYRALGATPMDEWTTFRLSGEALERLGGEALERPARG